VVEIYTADSIYVGDWWQKSESVSLDHNASRPILSDDKLTFSRIITSKIFGKQLATAVHTLRYLCIS
jgi:hypothetical protein